MGICEFIMNIGLTIAVLRKKKGMSQENLANETGLSRHYLYKVENNLSSPTLGTLEKISSVLNIKVSELIDLAERQILD